MEEQRQSAVAKYIEQFGGVRKVADLMGEEGGRALVSGTTVQSWRRTGEVYRLAHALTFARLIAPGKDKTSRLKRLDVLESMVPDHPRVRAKPEDKTAPTT